VTRAPPVKLDPNGEMANSSFPCESYTPTWVGTPASVPTTIATGSVGPDGTAAGCTSVGAAGSVGVGTGLAGADGSGTSGSVAARVWPETSFAYDTGLCCPASSEKTMFARPWASKYSCGENPVKWLPSPAAYPSALSATTVVVQPPLPSGVWYCSCEVCGEP